MQAVKGKNTSLERALFSMLVGMGLKGWKKNVGDVPGKPDVVFDRRLVIFVDGCFWHGCPTCRRKLPVTNREYWERKISRNVQSARKVDKTLAEMGWKVIRVWEHEVMDKRKRGAVRRRIRFAKKEDIRQDGGWISKDRARTPEDTE
jgi:DNA mismatch endonuclease (patch repair protein)